MTKDEFLATIKKGDAVSFDSDLPWTSRKIESDWITELIKLGSSSICIVNGIINGSIALESVSIKTHLIFESCLFKDDFNLFYCDIQEFFRFINCKLSNFRLRGSSFKKSLWLRSCQIVSLCDPRTRTMNEAKVDFGYVNVGTDLDWDGTTFSGRIVASGLTVGNNLHARSARFIGNCHFDHLKIGAKLDLDGSLFESSVIFLDAKIGALNISGTSFAESLQFDRALIYSSVFAFGSTFCKSTSLIAAKIFGQVAIVESIFEKELMLEGILAEDLFFNDCEMLGPFSLIGASLNSYSSTHSSFASDVVFNEATVEKSVLIRGTKFKKTLSVSRAHIKSSFSIVPLQIDNNLVDCHFLGCVTFSGSEIGGQFVVERADFKSDLNLQSLWVRHDLCIEQSIIRGCFILTAARIDGNAQMFRCHVSKTTEAVNAKFGQHAFFPLNTFKGKIDFFLANVASSLDLSSSQFFEEVLLDYAKVGGRVKIIGCRIEKTISSEMAVFNTITVKLSTPNDVSFSNSKGLILNMNGMTYNKIEVDHKFFLKTLARSESNKSRQPYLEYERALRRFGNEKAADEVYFQGRKQEEGSNLFARFISGYGVYPQRFLMLSGFLVISLTLLIQIPGFAQVSQTVSKENNCHEVPSISQSIGLAITTLSIFSSKDYEGWRISKCNFWENLNSEADDAQVAFKTNDKKVNDRTFGLINFLIVSTYKCFSALLIPFAFSQLSLLWKYRKTEK